MKPTRFEETNITYAEDQPQYIPLPGHVSEDGEATFCFELSEEEKQQIAETGVIWLSVLTFNQPLQPIRLSTLKPEIV